jgi:hypothetical protein
MEKVFTFEPLATKIFPKSVSSNVTGVISLFAIDTALPIILISWVVDVPLPCISKL